MDLAQPAAAKDVDPLLHGLTQKETIDLLIQGFKSDGPPGANQLYHTGAGRRLLPRNVVVQHAGYVMSVLGLACPDEAVKITGSPRAHGPWLNRNECELVTLNYPAYDNSGALAVVIEATVAPSGRVQAQFIGRLKRTAAWADLKI
jgi:hypothetical protein